MTNPASVTHADSAQRASDEPSTVTVETGKGPDRALNDVASDPAHDTRVGSDWTAEGGAAPSGPATAAPECARETDRGDETSGG
ncbi:hypothetical protein [Leucobacter aridicollis]|uniref:hypothetical protein n=1 Tax=Leucobacter aridicollis TaxID=283878 RepID=UPI002168BDEF|nr:hypothetical protein [Leucobacter aridicollis]MCS3429208.1 hypothetical protein [Leucobacter aridicollis]